MTTWEEKRTPGRFKNGNEFWYEGISPKFILSANDTLTLYSQLAENVKGHDFNLAVNVAQGKQTFEMATNAVKTIGSALLDVRRGNISSAFRRLGVPSSRVRPLKSKDVSGRWLEMQYGWLPLVSDVYEASKAYESITSGPRRSRVSATLSRSGLRDYSSSPSSYSLRGPCDDRLKVVYEMTEEISTARSLGLTDPTTVLWEIIPYSFVVDWFIPIGTYLENLNVIPKLKGRFLTTRFTKMSGSALPKAMGNVKTPPRLHVKYITMARTVSTSLSVPKPRFSSIEDAFSGKRLLNAIALVSQRLL